MHVDASSKKPWLSSLAMHFSIRTCRQELPIVSLGQHHHNCLCCLTAGRSQHQDRCKASLSIMLGGLLTLQAVLQPRPTRQRPLPAKVSHICKRASRPGGIAAQGPNMWIGSHGR